MTEREMKPPSDRDLTEKGLPLARGRAAFC